MPMPAWYDIVGLGERANEQCDGIDDAAGRGAARYNVRQHCRTGSMLRKDRLAGVAALSGYGD
eukprot:gene44052-16078_t